MSSRIGWLLLVVACLGCHTLAPQEGTQTDPLAAKLWAEGQSAMRRGHPDEALRLYEESLVADLSLSKNHLSMAAARLEKGDEVGACLHLARYVETHPDHVVVRAHYAELLLRQKRLDDARAQFERFEGDSQEWGKEMYAQRVHCHSRLTKIAQLDEDEYAEHLHRGIGLYLLAVERVELEGVDCDLCPEGLLFRAASELALARMTRPREARPNWYLYVVWSTLGLRQPALRALHEAEEAGPFTSLTPAERRELQMACQREQKGRHPE